MLSLDKTTENKLYRVTCIMLGLIEGTVVSRVLTAPSGDPSAYLIRGAKIAIRNVSAGKITVTQVTE